MFAKPGHLKLHPVTAHITRPGIPEHLEPELHIQFQDKEWHSDHRQGRNPEWDLGCHFEHHVREGCLENEIIFKMIDHKGLFHKDEPIGVHRCHVKHFCHEYGEHEKTIMLQHDGNDVCELLLKIHHKE